MKNGRTPTLAQKKLLKSHGLDPAEYLIIKNTPEALEVISRADLKKQEFRGTKPRIRRLEKEG